MPAKVRGASGGVNWRRLAIRLHLWGGLLTGPFLLVLGLSGAALVFRTEIESLESATPAVASSGPGAPSLDAVVGIGRTRHPPAEPYALRIPGAPGRPYRVELRAGRQHLEIAVDPSTISRCCRPAPRDRRGSIDAADRRRTRGRALCDGRRALG